MYNYGLPATPLITANDSVKINENHFGLYVWIGPMNSKMHNSMWFNEAQSA